MPTTKSHILSILILLTGCSTPKHINETTLKMTPYVPPANHPTSLELIDFQNLTITFQPPVLPYDSYAKASGIQGTVLVDFAIKEDGTVYSAKAISGPVELYTYCENFVKGFQYKPFPSLQNSKQVRSIFTCVMRLR